MHIGSQLTEIRPFLDALDRVLVLIDELAAEGIRIEHLDIGGQGELFASVFAATGVSLTSGAVSAAEGSTSLSPAATVIVASSCLDTSAAGCSGSLERSTAVAVSA